MTIVTIHEAKTHLSRLIKEALAGKDVTITNGRSGEKLARIVPAKPLAKKTRQLGWLREDSRGCDPLAYGFWDPIPDVELALWSSEVEYPDDDAPPA